MCTCILRYVYLGVKTYRPSCVRALSLQELTGGYEHVCVWCRRACAVLQVTTEAWLHRVSVSLSIGSDLLFLGAQQLLYWQVFA